jgi:spore coat polysaccharide biosynthesis protein SpsF
MSSRRFPGKVLAPMWGRPIIWHVLEAIRHALPDTPAVVITSDESSDDPLEAYLARRGVACFRGPLDDVFGRFRAALAAHPTDWVLRVCADSPLLGSRSLRAVTTAAGQPDVADTADLITTTARRTFPKGQNVELIKVRTLLALDPLVLTPSDREHVTPFLHRNPQRFVIRNVESGDPSEAQISLAVDTVDDLRRLEAMSGPELARFGCGHLLSASGRTEARGTSPD